MAVAPNPARRRALKQAAATCAAGALPLLVSRARAAMPDSEPFPSRPVTLWVPWPAGGATDGTLRLLAELASRPLGQRIVVENRGGAGGTLVMPVLQQAAPDGYTVAQLPQPALRAPYIQKVLWDPIRDTTPIIQLTGVTFGVVVPVDSPFRTFDDILAWGQTHRDGLTVSTNGFGTTPHLVMDELLSRRGIKWVHVPYKGTAEQMLAVSSGQVMVGVNSNGFAPFVDGGKLRLLVTFGERRSPRWSQVPTLKELGHGIVAMSPYGLVGPAGMPQPIVQTLHDAFRLALFDPLHVAELAKFDQEPAYLGPQAYGAAMRQAYAAEKVNVERLGLSRSGS